MYPSGDVLADVDGHPHDQIDVMIGGRLSEYVFYLTASFSTLGLPKPVATLDSMLERASTWARGAGAFATGPGRLRSPCPLLHAPSGSRSPQSLKGIREVTWDQNPRRKEMQWHQLRSSLSKRGSSAVGLPASS